MAIEQGCRVIKYSPDETSGEIKYLEGMAIPYAYLELKYIPLGGLNMANAKS